MPPSQPRRNMHLIRHLPPASDRACAVAIGNFDGLHLGHKAVLRAMHEAAQAHALIPTVLTFAPHPRRFFKQEAPAFSLTRLSDKLAGLAAQHVARIAMPRFDARFAAIRADDFLNHVLGQQLGAKAVITGENFAFGHKREGDSARLKAWGAANNIHIITVPPVRVGHEICSSSAIRAAIVAGNVAHATRLLGHAHRITGRVVRGDGRGRTLGFPTANIAMAPDMLLPAFGVYAVRATLGNATFAGVANIGIRPTIAVSNCASLEVHLFDTVQEIYGKKLTILLVDKIRDEQKFASLAALQNQIAMDSETARRILTHERS